MSGDQAPPVPAAAVEGELAKAIRDLVGCAETLCEDTELAATGTYGEATQVDVDPKQWQELANAIAYVKTLIDGEGPIHATQGVDAISAPAADPVRAALLDVAVERQRQIDAEGWTPEHDDEHNDGSLSRAAACYAVGFRIHATNGKISGHREWLWPRGWNFNPDDRRRELVKAGALIVAEIERLDRAALAGSEGV